MRIVAAPLVRGDGHGERGPWAASGRSKIGTRTPAQKALLAVVVDGVPVVNELGFEKVVALGVSISAGVRRDIGLVLGLGHAARPCAVPKTLHRDRHRDQEQVGLRFPLLAGTPAFEPRHDLKWFPVRISTLHSYIRIGEL